MKVALYARVSTADKDQNPETQLVRLRAFAIAREYEVVGEYVDFKSGTDPNRPKFKEVKEALRLGTVKGVIVVRLDRVMRSTVELLNFIKETERWGAALICVDQPIDTGSATGRLMITILGAMAQFEAEIGRERIRDGLARKKAEGFTLGRPRVPDEKASKRTLQRRAKKGGCPALNTNPPKTGDDNKTSFCHIDEKELEQPGFLIHPKNERF